MPDHLRIDHTDCNAAIITGDPDRLAAILQQFDTSKTITNARGFVCAEAKSGEVSFLIVSTGIGSPATAIVVEELVELGITCIIRLGTCGAIRRDIKPGELVVSTACVRDEGTTNSYIDWRFPAVADHVVLSELLSSAEELGLHPHVGITHCKDSYYSERYEKQVDPHGQGHRWAVLRSAGVLATEMEVSALFIIGTLRRIRTGAVLIVVGETKLVGFSQSLKGAVSMIQKTVRSIVKKKIMLPKPLIEHKKSFLGFSEDTHT